jgi:hypothetical protein
MTKEIWKILPQVTQIEESIDAAQKMVLGEIVFQFEGVKEPLLYAAHCRPIVLAPPSRPLRFSIATARSFSRAFSKKIYYPRRYPEPHRGCLEPGACRKGHAIARRSGF